MPEQIDYTEEEFEEAVREARNKVDGLIRYAAEIEAYDLIHYLAEARMNLSMAWEL